MAGTRKRPEDFPLPRLSTRQLMTISTATSLVMAAVSIFQAPEGRRSTITGQYVPPPYNPDQSTGPAGGQAPNRPAQAQQHGNPSAYH